MLRWLYFVYITPENQIFTDDEPCKALCFQAQRRLLLNLGCADSQRSSPGDLVSFWLEIILLICQMDRIMFSML